MHPTTLFQTNNLIVKGHAYKAPSYDEDGKEELFDAIELDFIIQVNGKLVSFTESFSVYEPNEGPGLSGSETGKTIREWSNWYLIVRMLAAMGYYVTEDRLTLASNHVINEWVRTLFKSEE